MRTLTKSAPTFAVGGHLPRAGDPSLTKRVFSRRLGQRVRIRSSIRTLDSRTNTRTRRTSHTGWQMHRHVAGLGATLYASRGPVVRVKEDDAWIGLMLAIETVAERTGAIFLRISPGIRQDFALHDAARAGPGGTRRSRRTRGLPYRSARRRRRSPCPLTAATGSTRAAFPSPRRGSGK